MPRRVPPRLVDVLAVVAAVSLVAVVTSIWAERHPLDSDRFADTVAGVLDDPEVVTAVSRAATDQTVDLMLLVVDPGDLLPWPLSGIGEGAERFVRDQLAEQMERVVETDTVQGWLRGAVRQTHSEVVTVIRDGRSPSGMLALDDEVVRLDLTGVVAAGLDGLVGRGLAPRALGGLQDALRDGLDELRSWLADNAGIDVGADVGTVVVYETSTVDDGGLALRSARGAAGAGDLPLFAWVLLLAVSGTAAALMDPDRWRSGAVFGLAVAVLAALAFLYWWRVAVDIEHLIDDPGLRRAARVVIAELMGPLRIAMLVLVSGGLVGGAVGAMGSRRGLRA
ncbi:MAG: hypothetical protein U5K29_05455 [Acidimicrobiales bacterium]|nr:hypothetical protein [Acidimicrobiales bacterium]